MKSLVIVPVIFFSLVLSGCVSQEQKPEITVIDQPIPEELVEAVQNLRQQTTKELITALNESSISDPSIKIKSNIDLEIGNQKLNSTDLGGLDVYECKDFINENQTLVTVGYLPMNEQLGFVLFDDSYEGLPVIVNREGLDKTWRWSNWDTKGIKENTPFDYLIEISPDGTGVYFDFTNASEDGKTKGSEVFKCFKNRWE